ncbi:restriction endonuclease subunit S [Micromonospora sp. C81]|uniref:restriction endonuclease subunit S n=1 Tax=Micromonospora sp. C81 TaxID=2824881 RepID=UPI001B394183|nr:restriction endonuclease subunit S [Micromonospora sp. C81]MBQ1038940.1 restriction endonuclease subunit S [Micromonospora sp. C81]
MTELPVGWVWVDLAEVAEVQGGIQKQAKRRPVLNKYPFLRVANVHRGKLDLADVHEVELFDDELERFELRRGDLLVVEGNGSPDQIGRAATWDGSIDKCVHQNHLIRVRPTAALLHDFLELVWNSPLVARHLREVAGSTSGLYTLSTGKLKSVRLPLPPIAEQQRIIDALEDALLSLNAGVANLTAGSLRLDSLSRSWTRNLLGSSLIKHRKLGELLAEKMINGKSVPTKAGGFPVLRLTALRGDGVDLAERKSGAWSFDEAKQYLVHQDDFLISRGNGSLRLVGRGGLVSQDSGRNPVAFPDTLIRVRVDKTAIRPEFLALVWNSPQVRRQIEQSARTTAGIYKVNQAILFDIALPVPKLDVQDRIVAQWKAAAEETQRLRAALMTAAKRAAQLRTSLLSTAFAGRLVPQDPNDEPAPELLARISAERAAAPPKQRARSRRTPKELAAPPTRVTGDNYQQEALPL